MNGGQKSIAWLSELVRDELLTQNSTVQPRDDRM
jgi:hypothetical protein